MRTRAAWAAVCSNPRDSLPTWGFGGPSLFLSCATGLAESVRAGVGLTTQRGNIADGTAFWMTG